MDHTPGHLNISNGNSAPEWTHDHLQECTIDHIRSERLSTLYAVIGVLLALYGLALLPAIVWAVWTWAL